MLNPKAPSVREQVLADGIPALSNAAGGPDGGGMSSSHNMNSLKGFHTQGLWPRDNDRWLHSDKKNMAYPYTYDVFNKIVAAGGL